MSVINVLDTQSANMIAAGEVVDRPASVVKELVENAIDAGATAVTVEIKNGGSGLIRVSDNGVGMTRADMPRSLLRHATSKITKGDDLATVLTRGFRGEALAAISSVSELEMISRTAQKDTGSVMHSDDSGIRIVETGCPVGTTVVVRNLFYNTPARRKFLRTDRAEAAACRVAAERQALSCPDIAFKFVSDGELKFSTNGNGKIRDAIADIVGISTVRQLLPISASTDLIKLYGYVGSPKLAKGRNNSQNAFVNGRFVVSKVIQAATKDAFHTYMPRDSFPVSYIYIELPTQFVDVNVHPAKTEVKFYDDQQIYEAVYFAVKTALEKDNAFTGDSADIFVESTEVYSNGTATEAQQQAEASEKQDFTLTAFDTVASSPYVAEKSTEVPEAIESTESTDEYAETLFFTEAEQKQEKQETAVRSEAEDTDMLSVQGTIYSDEDTAYTYIGEIYNSYLIAETEGVMYIVDKHAAHERLLYEQFKSTTRAQSQQMLFTIPVQFDPQSAELLADNMEYLEEIGFKTDGAPVNGMFYFEAVPQFLQNPFDIQPLLESFAEKFAEGDGMPVYERFDRALFTMACKAALKAGIPNRAEHNKWILDSLFKKKNIKYCPHGRPIAKAFPKREMDKWFDR